MKRNRWCECTFAALCFAVLPSAAAQNTATRPGPLSLRSPSTDAQSSEDASPNGTPTIARSRDRGGAVGDEWHFTLSPYLWTTSISADAEVRGLSASPEACFTDLLKNLDGAAQLRFEGRKGPWGFFLDGTYLSLSNETDVRTRGFPLRGLEGDVTFTQAWLDFGGYYRLGRPGNSFDVMLGGRYAYVSTELSLGSLVEVEESKNYVTPMIGGRWELALSDKWLLALVADASGFGVGGADLIWGASALVGYRANERITLGFGYRFYDMEFNTDRLNLDLQYHGPIVGMVVHF